jgi:hypothetical protein
VKSIRSLQSVWLLMKLLDLWLILLWLKSSWPWFWVHETLCLFVRKTFSFACKFWSLERSNKIKRKNESILRSFEQERGVCLSPSLMVYGRFNAWKAYVRSVMI